VGTSQRVVKAASFTLMLATAAQQRVDLERAEELFTESLARWRQVQDHCGIASTLYELACMALARADTSRAEALYRESLELWSNLADRRASVEPVEAWRGSLPAEAKAGGRRAYSAPRLPTERGSA
jgi:tetratricopeptide repeat protein